MKSVERLYRRSHWLGGSTKYGTRQRKEMYTLFDSSKFLMSASDTGVVERRFQTEQIDRPPRLHSEQLARICVVPASPRGEPPSLAEENAQDGTGVEIDFQR